MERFKILLVEDEKKIAGSLCQGLTENNYDVDIAYDGVVAKRLFQDNGYDLAILDINLPLLNGYDLCRHIRIQNERIPIIMLTARGNVEDKLTGFQSGADDYLAKPFDFKELLARIRAVLKRLQNFSPTNNYLKVADLIMHLDSMEVIRNNKRITLTAKEFQLLEYFIRNKNRVLSRADIAVDVWNIDFDTRTNVIDVYVNFLRKKIDKNFSHKLIHTYVGVGYTLKDNFGR